MSEYTKYFSARRVGEMLLVTIVLWLPLYRGGYTNETVALLFACAGIVFVLSMQYLEFQTLKLWGLVWCVFATTIFLQPYSSTLFAYNNALVNNAISVDSLYVLVLFSSMWLICWGISLLGRSGLAYLLFFLMLASSFQAVYGTFHFLTGAESVLGLWDKKYYSNGATGTFVNRNHYAGMLAMSWPIIVSALLEKKPTILPRVDFPIRLFIAILYSAFILVALISSGSRMGLIAAAFGVFVSMLVVLKRKVVVNEFGRSQTKYISILAFGLIVLFALWFGIEDIAVRYTRLENGDSRFDIWQAMFDLPASLWVFGIGVGSFEDVFHLVQPTYLAKSFAYAHNDYLQFLLEFGGVAALFIILAFSWLVYKALPKGGYGQRAGAVGSLAAVALHSLVDCNLQIPGSAIVAWIAFGLIMNRNMVDQIDLEVNSDVNVGIKQNAKRRSKTGKRGLPKTRREWLAFFRSD